MSHTPLANPRRIFTNDETFLKLFFFCLYYYAISPS